MNVHKAWKKTLFFTNLDIYTHSRRDSWSHWLYCWCFILAHRNCYDFCLYSADKPLYTLPSLNSSVVTPVHGAGQALQEYLLSSRKHPQSPWKCGQVRKENHVGQISIGIAGGTPRGLIEQKELFCLHKWLLRCNDGMQYSYLWQKRYSWDFRSSLLVCMWNPVKDSSISSLQPEWMNSRNWS